MAMSGIGGSRNVQMPKAFPVGLLPLALALVLP